MGYEQSAISNQLSAISSYLHLYIVSLTLFPSPLGEGRCCSTIPNFITTTSSTKHIQTKRFQTHTFLHFHTPQTSSASPTYISSTCYEPGHPSPLGGAGPGGEGYSVRSDFTGFATAAFIALMLTVINAIPNVISAANTKIHQLTFVL